MIHVFHTNEHRGNILEKPVFASGNEQWLGEGWYFWQEYEFANAWGEILCSKKKDLDSYDIYSAMLDIEFSQESDTLDTVFNEEHYYFFKSLVEDFAKEYRIQTGKKPSLTHFSDFINSHGLWRKVVAIRFQDLPTNDKKSYLRVKGFFYNKRIQIVLRRIERLHSFDLLKTRKCK